MSLSFKQFLIEVHEAEGEIDSDKLIEMARGTVRKLSKAKSPKVDKELDRTNNLDAKQRRMAKGREIERSK